MQGIEAALHMDVLYFFLILKGISSKFMNMKIEIEISSISFQNG